MEYISDTNVWIDFYKISRTQLPFRMSCKYIMFHEAMEKELLYPEDLKSQLIDGGLLGVEITTEELFYADELSGKLYHWSIPLANIIAKGGCENFIMKYNMMSGSKPHSLCKIIAH